MIVKICSFHVTFFRRKVYLYTNINTRVTPAHYLGDNHPTQDNPMTDYDYGLRKFVDIDQLEVDKIKEKSEKNERKIREKGFELQPPYGI